MINDKIELDYYDLWNEIKDLKKSDEYQSEPCFSEMVRLELKSWKLFILMNPTDSDLDRKFEEIWANLDEFELLSNDRFYIFIRQLKKRIKYIENYF